MKLDKTERTLLTIIIILALAIIFLLAYAFGVLGRLQMFLESRINSFHAPVTTVTNYNMRTPPRIQQDFLLTPFRSSDDYRDELYTYEIYRENAGNGETHMQGACTDGTYIWVGWSNPCMLIKMCILTREITRIQYAPDDWPYGHFNDITYYPAANELFVVARTDEKTNGGKIVVLDAESLKPKSSFTLRQDGKELAVSGIAYDRLNDFFIFVNRNSGGTGKVVFSFFDSSFHFIRSVVTERREAFSHPQGIETDGKYIYRSLWNYFDRNAISVYDFSGNFVKLIDVPISGNGAELQDIMYDWNGSWYINTADYHDEIAGSTFYYAGLQETADYSQMERLLTWITQRYSTIQAPSDH